MLVSVFLARRANETRLLSKFTHSMTRPNFRGSIRYMPFLGWYCLPPYPAPTTVVMHDKYWMVTDHLAFWYSFFFFFTLLLSSFWTSLLSQVSSLLPPPALGNI